MSSQETKHRICGKCGQPPENHFRRMIMELGRGGGARRITVLTCMSGQGEYEEARDTTEQ